MIQICFKLFKKKIYTDIKEIRNKIHALLLQNNTHLMQNDKNFLNTYEIKCTYYP